MGNAMGAQTVHQTGASTRVRVNWHKIPGADADRSHANIDETQFRLQSAVPSAIPKCQSEAEEIFSMPTRNVLDASVMPRRLSRLGDLDVRACVFVGLGALAIFGSGVAGYMLGA